MAASDFFARYLTDIPLDIYLDCMLEGLELPQDPSWPDPPQEVPDSDGWPEPPADHRISAMAPFFPEPPSLRRIGHRLDFLSDPSDLTDSQHPIVEVWVNPLDLVEIEIV